ncbi:MAG TPA: hypothetical protein VH413_12700 [Verrucomicrobiae bacterium]|jgi:hypothetical protein|nr:hypothetical protein [Verrucomicrobiae bacterium]
MSKSVAKTPLLLAAWILLSAFLNCAGWLLSGVHQLNQPGYLCLFALAAIAIFLWAKKHPQTFQPWSFYREKKRLHRFLPLGFSIIAGMTLLGALLYAPTNYDALAYRMPRILHWIAADRWHWVHTSFNRLNTRAVGFEWLATPMILFTRTDRWVFLINIASFLLLPGLFFSTLTRLGVRRRVAWCWMWILPTGYSYLIQSGGIGNDLFGATFALAAFDLALRARDSKSRVDLYLAALAAALLAGSKLSNLPLLLPWFLATLPSLELLKTKWLATAAVVVASIVCSFLPIAVVNYEYCHDWTGFAAEGMPFDHPTYALHLTHNTILMTVQNLTPPVFPIASAWNRMVLRLQSPELKAKLEENFEPSQAHIVLRELQMEETAGLGFGVSLLLIFSLVATWKYSRTRTILPRPPNGLWHWALVLSPWFSLAVFMAKSGLSSEARLATPYYGLLMPLLLSPRSLERIVQTLWWRTGALIVFLLAAVVLILSPPRPLWPAQTILARLPTSSRLIERARVVYSVYGERSDAFAPVRSVVPADVKVLGLIATDYPETSLWRPFGLRRIEHIMANDDRENLQQRGIEYILLNQRDFKVIGLPLNDWLAKINAEVVQTIPMTIRAGFGSEDWLLVKLKN